VVAVEVHLVVAVEDVEATAEELALPVTGAVAVLVAVAVALLAVVRVFDVEPSSELPSSSELSSSALGLLVNHQNPVAPPPIARNRAIARISIPPVPLLCGRGGGAAWTWPPALEPA